MLLLLITVLDAIVLVRLLLIRAAGVGFGGAGGGPKHHEAH